MENKYFVAMRDGPDKVRFQGYKGEPVTIEGYEAFHLFIHHPPSWGKSQYETWTISEATSGLAICGWAPSEEEAKVMAKQNLDKIRPGGFKEKLEAHFKKFDRSPWVER